MYRIHFLRQIGSCCVSYSAFKQSSWLTECFTLLPPVFRRTKHTASQRTQLRPIFGITCRSFGLTFGVEVKKDKCSVVIRNSVFSWELRVKLCYFQTFSIQWWKTAERSSGLKWRAIFARNTACWNDLFRLKIPTSLYIQYSSTETCQDGFVLSLYQEEPCGRNITHRLPGCVTRTGYRRQIHSTFYGKVAFCTSLSHVLCWLDPASLVFVWCMQNF
jgi:hypothetical protein